jgi:hypothetical protein
MSSPQRQSKHIQRQLRTIPVDAIASHVTAWERDGLWCLVGGELMFVPVDGGVGESHWDDPLEYAQFRRYVAAQPERVHDSWESAQAFVRSRLG